MDTIELDLRIEKATSSRLHEIDFNNIPFGRIYSDHMFVADYIDGEWQDSRIVPFDNLSLSPATSALHYGQSVFEGLKAYRNEGSEEVTIFRPDQNFERMNESAIRICMPTIPEELFMGGMMELLNIDRNWVPDLPGTSLYIRPFLFATDEYIGLKPSQSYKFMIFTCPVGNYYSEPVKVKVETFYSRACAGGTGAAKFAGNYAGSMYPAKLAQEQGYDQLIWTDAKEHKYIEEAGTMNLMFFIEDKLVTAPAGDTILHGITRKSVLQLAKEWGYNVEERPIEVVEIVEAYQSGKLKEAFGVGTAATIAHIALIHFNGMDMDLPKIETREFSNRVLKELSALQRGQIEDVRNWVFKV